MHQSEMEKCMLFRWNQKRERKMSCILSVLMVVIMLLSGCAGKKTKRPNIILCEGNLDIVTLHQAGFDNAVASMGTALTQEQIRLLSRFTKELVL